MSFTLQIVHFVVTSTINRWLVLQNYVLLSISSDKIHQQMNVWSAQMSEWNKKMQYNIKSWSNTVSVQLKSARSQIKSAVHIAVDYVKVFNLLNYF